MVLSLDRTISAAAVIRFDTSGKTPAEWHHRNEFTLSPRGEIRCGLLRFDTRDRTPAALRRLALVRPVIAQFIAHHRRVGSV